MSPRPLLPLSRRAAVGAALAAAGAASGCDFTDSGRPGGSPSGTPGDAPAGDPDEQLVDDVRAELDDLVAIVAALSARGRRLRRSLAALLALNTAHRDLMAHPDASGTPAPVTVPEGAAPELWGFALERERRAQRRLEDWAVRAESGPLARALASMSAGIAVHLADAPGELP